MKSTFSFDCGYGLELAVDGDLLADEGVRNGIRLLLEEAQILLIRNQNLDLQRQLALTSLLGVPEPAWEDEHPASAHVQLMDSALQVKIDVKSSSKHWHVDRSFMSSPSRFTVLYAHHISGDVRPTQFLSGLELYDRLADRVGHDLTTIWATHSFSDKFPFIMGKKGVDTAYIERQRSLYPDSHHPLTRQHCSGRSALYFSELCTSRIDGLPEAASDRLIAQLTQELESCPNMYEHVWQPGDILIWDNYSTIHRAKPESGNGRRILHRTTTGG